MVRCTLQIERALIYLYAIVFPWQTIWIYQTGMVNGVLSPYLTLGLYASEVIMWLLCIVVFFNFKSSVVSTTLDTRAKWKKLFLVLLFCASPLYVLMNAWWSIHFDVSIRHALFVIEGYMLLTAIVVSRISVQEWVRAFVVGAIVPVVLGLFQWFTQTSFSSTLFGLTEHIAANSGSSIVASDTIGRWLRAYGSFPHPNIFGWYLVCVLACTCMYSWSIQKRYEKISLLIIHTAAAFALFATLSRSAISAYILVVIGFLLYALKHKMKNILLLIACSILSGLVFGILYHDIVYTRTIPISISETRSLSERQEGIEVAWELHRLKPVFGFGGGMFVRAWHEYEPILSGFIYQPAHIVLFVALVEYGCVGVILLSVSFGLFVWLGIRRSGMMRTLFWVSGVLPFVFISFFDHYFVTLYPGIILFFAYLGLFFKFSTETPQYVHKI